MMFDVAVVGAGPAGLAAAVHAAEAGLAVVLVDAGNQPGGQFWRHADENASSANGHLETASSAPAEKSAEGRGTTIGSALNLRARLYAAEESGAVAYWRNTQVWLIEGSERGGRQPEGSEREDQAPEGTASRSRCTTLRLTPTFDDAAATDDSSQDSSETSSLAGSAPGSPTGSVPDLVRAAHVILCPGGYDRQLPVPGWELPGVMAAGGVQALLKGSGTAVGSVAVVGGTGPFLLPVATALAKAGVKVAAICEANSPLGWLRHGAGAIRAPEKAGEGLEYAAALARHRIPYKVRTAVTSIHGTDRVEAVTISKVSANGSPVPGSGKRIACDLLALGWGFSAQLELVMAAGAETEIDVDGSLVAIVDERMMSTVPGVSVAGEATGVGGAAMAVTEGELAALCVAAMNAAVNAP
ncbi:FAD-dependent oxidoreductase [Arthrobacter alpinus]|nr:FAD-dependent oxidoreductase [Arthrobacter alpinus]